MRRRDGGPRGRFGERETKTEKGERKSTKDPGQRSRGSTGTQRRGLGWEDPEKTAGRENQERGQARCGGSHL